jgi:hypothetical protein
MTAAASFAAANRFHRAAPVEGKSEENFEIRSKFAIALQL